ncbi:MAG: DUF6145 family protein [Anaerostipes sp.]|nr:DUF6145 family protein [Anaerostipes sp.]
MYQDNMVLCGASSYEQKYYLNEDFNGLPQGIKDELKIACVLYTAEAGGIITIEYDEEGNLHFVTEAKENDYMFDEIGSGLKIKQMQMDKKELWESLEMFYKVFFLGEEVE